MKYVPTAVLVMWMVVGVSMVGTLALGRCLNMLACGLTTMMPGQRVVIQSPNFPREYITNYRCQYEITCNTEKSTYLEFRCPRFQLEYSKNCVKDRLIVKSRGSREVKCGKDSPNGIITSTGWTRLTFFSNRKIVARGFRCFIWCRRRTTTTSTTSTTTVATTDAQ
ncbi:tumor necrosis factor-inducible gene 6 protein-like [Panulirus ornatus]|uniref:tumor necrosis factor-inducible gene 6 protein-like n=1 Tax=Panulirus ornatus TaxID=150431 RepID=UPI003A8C83A6